MDFVKGLPPLHEYIIILVVIDRLFKYAHLAALKIAYTSYQVAEKFFDIIVKHHVMPSSIVVDQDRVFTSAFWQQ